MSNKRNIWTRDYVGFESINDFDEDWIYDALPAVQPDGEFTGTIRITFEYIPDDEEENDNMSEL